MKYLFQVVHSTVILLLVNHTTWFASYNNKNDNNTDNKNVTIAHLTYWCLGCDIYLEHGMAKTSAILNNFITYYIPISNNITCQFTGTSHNLSYTCLFIILILSGYSYT